MFQCKHKNVYYFRDPGYEYPPEPEICFKNDNDDGNDNDDADDDDDDDDDHNHHSDNKNSKMHRRNSEMNGKFHMKIGRDMKFQD